MKLIKVKQIIAEVVKNSHISSEIKKLVTEDNNLQQSIEQYVNNTEVSQEEVETALNEFPVEDIANPYEQTIDEMIAEEVEEAKKVFVTEFSEEVPEEDEAEASYQRGGRESPEKEEGDSQQVKAALININKITNTTQYAQFLKSVLQYAFVNKKIDSKRAISIASAPQVATAIIQLFGKQ